MNSTAKETHLEYEKRVIALMIALFCNKNHGTGRGTLCKECDSLTRYAWRHTENCRKGEEKTLCGNCQSPCYSPAKREAIRQVMRYSGPRMLLHHPVLAIQHLVYDRREKAALRKSE